MIWLDSNVFFKSFGITSFNTKSICILFLCHVQVLLTASTAPLSMFMFRRARVIKENGTKRTVAFFVVNFLQTV